MKSRSFGDLLVGVLAYVSLSVVARATAARPAQGRDQRWALPGARRRRRRTGEDACRHCTGSGHCEACLPMSCRVCRGSGLQPRDLTLVPRLTALWDGSSQRI